MPAAYLCSGPQGTRRARSCNAFQTPFHERPGYGMIAAGVSKMVPWALS